LILLEYIVQEKAIIQKYRNVAIVGFSPDEEKASYRVGKYLSEHGYNIFPVNPMVSEIMGKKCYPNLTAIPDNIEVVDIFRKSEEVVPVVREAIKIGARVVWMQLGIVNEDAAKIAREAGLSVVMDKCMKKSHEALNIEK
jgi:predicted CoA-binding protein